MGGSRVPAQPGVWETERGMNGEILIVDDDPSICGTVTTILARAGWNVTAVESGPECLSLLETGFRGLVLMDIMMPCMDGWQTIEEMVRRGLHEGNVICMLTAVDDPGPELDSLKEYVLDYVRKPFTVEDLLQAVEMGLSCIG